MEKKSRQRQNKKPDTDQKHHIKKKDSQSLSKPGHSSTERPNTTTNTSFYPREADHITFLIETPPGPTLTNFVLHLQQTRGNMYVQRVLQAVRNDTSTSEVVLSNGSVPAGTIQRGPTDPSTEVPALITSTVQQVNTALGQGTPASRQQAVNLIVAALVTAGSIDAQRIQNGRVVYQPGFAPAGGGYGLTSLTPGTVSPRPCRVRIGDGAITNASTLYSTIMHEYQHVNQMWENTPGSEAIHEIQAYLYEIEHISQSGLNNNLTQLSLLRRQLMIYWNRANPPDCAPFQQRYDRALQTIEDRIREIQTGG